MQMPEAQSTESSSAARPPVYYEYCYTVQLFAGPDDISWSGTYGVHAAMRADSRSGDGPNVKQGLGREGRITGGNDLIASSDTDAIKQLDDRYGTPNYRLLSLDRRGAVGLGGS